MKPDRIAKQLPVFEDIETWPIYKLYQDRKAFVAEIDDFSVQRLLINHPGDLEDLVSQTIYQERIRMKETPWKVDPPADRGFWNRIRSGLLAGALESGPAQIRKSNAALLRKVVHRYSEEIAGGFSKGIFLFARRFLTYFFTRLLNVAAPDNFWGLFRTRFRLHERIQVFGEIEIIRSLFNKGTVVVVPTHFSNLDSIMIGYAMDEVVGLPAFSYGAGLNLYNFGPAAFFMNRLGAYRLDRRKRNPIYLETLKAVSLLSIKRGVNNLFFPGGTRSRSGSLEKRIKLGLLGTAVEAQRMLFEEKSDRKVFIVPLVLSYHFVLEAPFLIEQHLQEVGKEKYLQGRDGSTSIRKWVRFVWSFFKQRNDIVLNFGRPMDVMGNFINADGASVNKFGREVAVADYFTSGGVITADLQRENEYTKLLSEKLVQRYHIENIVLHTHLVAFAAFRLLLSHHPKLDLFEVLRLPSDDYLIPFQSLKGAVEAVVAELVRLSEAGKLQIHADVYKDAEWMIDDALLRLSMFHIKKPLRMNERKEIDSEDFHTLYYYHNRLVNYDIEKRIPWQLFPVVYQPD